VGSNFLLWQTVSILHNVKHMDEATHDEKLLA